MKWQISIHLAGILMFATLGCAKPKVWVPPRIDLHQYGTLGMIEFESSKGYGRMATRQLVATLHSAQAGVPVLELGPLADVLHSVGHTTTGPDAVRAIGERYRVDVVVLGGLDIDEPRPNFSIQSFTEANASAEILGTLNARFLDTRSGATIWSDQARGKRTVAHLNVAAGRIPRFGAVDPEGEHAQLVTWLVSHVTDDFRGYWARQ
jgi:hypothetical protein